MDKNTLQYKLRFEVADIGKFIIDVNNAKSRLEVLINSKNVAFGLKNDFRRWIRNLDSILKHFNMLMPVTSKNIMQEQLLNDESTMQIDNCTSLMMLLTKPYRDKIEEFIIKKSEEYEEELTETTKQTDI